MSVVFHPVTLAQIPANEICGICREPPAETQRWMAHLNSNGSNSLVHYIHKRCLTQLVLNGYDKCSICHVTMFTALKLRLVAWIYQNRIAIGSITSILGPTIMQQKMSYGGRELNSGALLGSAIATAEELVQSRIKLEDAATGWNLALVSISIITNRFLTGHNLTLPALDTLPLFVLAFLVNGVATLVFMKLLKIGCERLAN